jgi:uncharacterized OB-fold protein
MPEVIAAVNYLALGDEPSLVANECSSCSALYFDRRNACAKCAGMEFTTRQLSTEGVLKAYTIVHRAAKGQDVPYTSCVVALDGGGVVKANLRGVTVPDQIKAGTRVQLVTFPAGKDDDGTTAIAFGFKAIGVSR